jgi:hypothetical protein
MRKLKIIILFLSIFLISNFGYSQVINFLNNFKPGSEPDGFRGINWGTDVSTLKLRDLKLIDESPDGQTKCYDRKDDVMEIGAAKIKNIGYCFWRGKFFAVIVTPLGGSGNALKYASFEKFGEGARMSSYSEEFQWDGKKTFMRFEIRHIDEGILYIQSNEVGKQKEEYEKQKAKEGAKKGF